MFLPIFLALVIFELVLGSFHYVFEGQVTAIAGTGRKPQTFMPFTSGPALRANLGSAYGLWKDPNGNVYFTDSLIHAIYKVDPNGEISLLAGASDGSSGLATDGASLSTVKFNRPRGLWGDSTGTNLYVADTINHRVWRLDLTSNTIYLFAGNGQHASPATSGKATASPLFSPFAGYTDVQGNVYIADLHRCVISKVDTSGDISLFAGSAGSCFTTSSTSGSNSKYLKINYPSSISGDNNGNVYFTEMRGNVVRKVSADGSWSTVLGTTAGNTGLVETASELPASEVVLDSPSGIWSDGSGNLFVSSAKEGIVRFLNKETNTVVSIMSGLNHPRCVWSDGSVLFISNTGSRQVVKMTVKTTSRRRLGSSFNETHTNF